MLELQDRKMNTLVLITRQTSQSAVGRRSGRRQGGRRRGRHHDKTLRASVSILRSSFTPIRPSWIFSGLSSTSTLLVNGSNFTKKGRLIPAAYPLVNDWKQQIKMSMSSLSSISGNQTFYWPENIHPVGVCPVVYHNNGHILLLSAPH